MASLYGLLVMSLTYDASNNTYSADLDTGEVDFSSGFEATKVKRVEISKAEFNRIKREVEQQELNRLAQQRLEQLHKMFEETRMAEQREQLGHDISRALFQRHGMFTSSPYERDTDTLVFGSNKRVQDVINGTVPSLTSC